MIYLSLSIKSHWSIALIFFVLCQEQESGNQLVQQTFLYHSQHGRDTKTRQ